MYEADEGNLFVALENRFILLRMFLIQNLNKHEFSTHNGKFQMSATKIASSLRAILVVPRFRSRSQLTARGSLRPPDAMRPPFTCTSI
jgi:hypothetical protein